MIISKLPLILHILIETAAARSFIFQPQSQLPLDQARDGDGGATRREADLILSNLGGALLTTNLVALVLVLRPDDQALDRTGRLMALALASYHVWPAYRAISRIFFLRPVAPSRATMRVDAPLGGPPVHLAVHTVCLAGLLGSGLFGGTDR
ncbi:hypothetical protein MAPG_08206 [Magnaporthiopsis poae ATCC 64411]|uniref:Integral membrane protein n=1 Tax=Magnaporthiopsis poae (strain ATCC 64411 / 73-15) TaxID=644358 RepID=A0A0C4E6R0_MAGP6|nr:hypothetical protein MAPG_08206 [Magnaporthiopsis poae ATCC 64411]